MSTPVLNSLYKKYRNVILYGVIGASCAGLDFMYYTGLCYLCILPYLWANVVSIHCGIICSFFLNQKYNFRVKDKSTLRFLSFYLVGLTGLGISELMLYFTVDIAGWHELRCKLISIIVIVLVQFFLNKYVTFKTSSTGHPCRTDFEYFASLVGLNPVRYNAVLDLFEEIPTSVENMVSASALPDKYKRIYMRTINERTARFNRKNV